MPHQQFDNIIVLIHGIIAMFGGIANALTRRELKLLTFISDIFIAAFTGTMAAFIMLRFSESNYLTYAVSGSFGYAGKAGMDWLFEVIKKSFKANIK